MSPTADQILASKTEDELRAGIERAKCRLALLEAMEGVDYELDGDGPFPPSKDFEAWVNGFSNPEKRLLHIGISDCRKELARRGAAPSAA